VEEITEDYVNTIKYIDKASCPEETETSLFTPCHSLLDSPPKQIYRYGIRQSHTLFLPGTIYQLSLPPNSCCFGKLKIQQNCSVLATIETKCSNFEVFLSSKLAHPTHLNHEVKFSLPKFTVDLGQFSSAFLFATFYAHNSFTFLFSFEYVESNYFILV
jgi:hypothetical protein